MSRDLAEKEALMFFLEGLAMAAKGAHALGVFQERPHFLAVRDQLEAVRTMGAKLAMTSPVPRQEVLRVIDHRRLAAGAKTTPRPRIIQ